MSNPEWLNQVQKFTSTQAQAEGKSETGAALAAIADGMGAENHEPFAAGEVVGFYVDHPAAKHYGVIVSSGSVAADVARVAKQLRIEEKLINLMSASTMLQERFSGVAACHIFN